MKKIAFIMLMFVSLILGFTSCTEEPQETTGSISGLVTTGTTGTTPLEGVNISIPALGISATSGTNGGYKFRGIKPGMYTLKFQKTGYVSDQRAVIVTAGKETVTDIIMTEEKTISKIELNHETLLFDKGVNELTLQIHNVGNTTVNWTIDGISVSWLAVSPRTGETRAGSTSSVKVVVDRSAISGSTTTSTSFNVRGSGFSIPVTVEVSSINSSGNEADVYGSIKGRVTDSSTNTAISNALTYVLPGFNAARTDDYGFFEIGELAPGAYTLTVTSEGYDDADIKLTVNGGKTTSVNVQLVKTQSEPDDPDEPDVPDNPGVKEDYSKVKITSCDYRVQASVVSCHRYGDTVTFEYTLTNTGLGNVNDWRFYPPKSMSLISGGTRTSVWTNDGIEYLYPTMVFRGKATNKENPTAYEFPQDMPCRGSITITNVSTSATELNVNLGVYAYPNSQYNMAKSVISFLNIPIY